MQYQAVKRSLKLPKAGKWLSRDSSDDFFPDALNFSDIVDNLDEYLSQRERRLFQLDTLPQIVDFVPKSSGMIREAVWLHPTHRILYLGALHYLLPKLDHHLPPEVYSYRKDSQDNDSYPFTKTMDRWKRFHNDFRHACLDEGTNAILVTDIASYYDHINVDKLCFRIRAMLGDAASSEDIDIVNFLCSLLKQWSSDGFGIPQNLDASSFLGSLFLSGVDKEMLDKRYRYFRWVDDIKICASNKKQAFRALHDLQKALARYRMFLASDKTTIMEKDSEEFDELVDVADDSHISKLEKIVARGSKEEIDKELPFAQTKLEHHAGKRGDDRKFRAYANRLLQLSEYDEYRDEIYRHLGPLVAKRLESHPQKSDYWTKILQEFPPEYWQDKVEELLRTNPSVFNWQRFFLWKLLTAREHISEELISRARSTINNPVSDLEAYQAIICIGRHGNNQEREGLFVQYFNSQKSYPIQRAILISIQEMEKASRNRLYEEALKKCPEHTQLVKYLQSLEAPKYGIKFRTRRQLPEQPRELPHEILCGVGKVNGKTIRYRLSRNDFYYE